MPAFALENFKLIVGLGNVGKQYEKSRHNSGFLFLDFLKKQIPEYKTLEWQNESKFSAEILKAANLPILAKPTTMMNNSGQSVSQLKNYFKLESSEILVAFDDLDMPLGTFKLQFAKGPKVHNGLNSVANRLSTSDFWHLRIGIENREVKGNKGIPGMQFSLANFTQVELELLRKVFKSIFKENTD